MISAALASIHIYPVQVLASAKLPALAWPVGDGCYLR